jgi:hypothetical protein
MKKLALIPGVIIMSFAAVYFVMAWTGPTGEAPDDNIPPPLNSGTTGQSKAGGLILNTGGATNGLIVQNGNVGIGTDSPGAELEVNGNAIALDPTESNHLATKYYVDETATSYRMTASSYESGGVYYAQTKTYSCPDGASATQVYCSDQSFHPPYPTPSQTPFNLCSCSTNGNAAYLTANVLRTSTSIIGCNPVTSYSAINSCSPASIYSESCGMYQTVVCTNTTNCEMRFQCGEVVTVGQ